LYPGMGGGIGVGVRSESPETVASFALHSTCNSTSGEGSGRQSPNAPGPPSSNSISDEGDLSLMFNFDLEPVSNDIEKMNYSGNAIASGSGSGWMTGVLPFDIW
jgi:hypothetical protein